MENNMRTTNLNNYVNLLNEVYVQGSITNEICRRHKVSCQSIGSLKKLKYADNKGKSLIKKQPSTRDALKVISKNREIAQKYNGKINQTEIKFAKPKEAIKVAPIKKENTKTTEINLFWGMIKIKR
jgi:hypothetical protein